jgi:hypothetical protein
VDKYGKIAIVALNYRTHAFALWTNLLSMQKSSIFKVKVSKFARYAFDPFDSSG